jgi:hypothetical protein
LKAWLRPLCEIAVHDHAWGRRRNRWHPLKEHARDPTPIPRLEVVERAGPVDPDGLRGHPVPQDVQYPTGQPRGLRSRTPHDLASSSQQPEASRDRSRGDGSSRYRSAPLPRAAQIDNRVRGKRRPERQADRLGFGCGSQSSRLVTRWCSAAAPCSTRRPLQCKVTPIVDCHPPQGGSGSLRTNPEALVRYTRSRMHTTCRDTVPPREDL